MSRTTGIASVMAACCIVAVAFNVIAFAMPYPRLGTFWVCYAFIWIGIMGVVAANLYVFMRSRTATEAVYSSSVVGTSIVYLVAAVAVSLLCMRLLFVPAWLALTVHVALLSVCLVRCIAGGAAGRIVADGDERTARQTNTMKTLRMQSELVHGGVADPVAKSAVGKIVESLRYSDPMSSPHTEYLENQLLSLMMELNGAAPSNDAARIVGICDQFQRVLEQRNALCRKAK